MFVLLFDTCAHMNVGNLGMCDACMLTQAHMSTIT